MNSRPGHPKTTVESAKRSARVEFHAIVSSGEAVGRDEAGKTVFAPFAAPGDVARVEISAEKTGFVRGLISEIAIASPGRVAPPCPQFRPKTPQNSCGGCAWQHVSLQVQRAAKAEIVLGALRRIGGVQGDLNIEAVRSGAGFGYRNKADFVIGRGDADAEIGFFARESHDLVDAPSCPIQTPKNEDVLRAARDILGKNPDFAFDARSGRGIWRRLVSRVSSGGETLATLVLNDPKSLTSAQTAQIAAQLRVQVPHLVGVLATAGRGEAKLLWGRDFLVESVNGLDFRVSGGAFWQVNTEMTPQMASAVLELANVKKGEHALDLFCGAGFFALHLARAGADVTGIETHRGAMRDAIWNAERNALKARFRAGEAERELSRFGPGDFDLIVLDPPRTGARDCLSALLRIAPKRLIYVSCDPATWARDAKILLENGYALGRVIPFDLFPQTSHVEVVSSFERVV